MITSAPLTKLDRPFLHGLPDPTPPILRIHPECLHETFREWPSGIEYRRPPLIAPDNLNHEPEEADAPALHESPEKNRLLDVILTGRNVPRLTETVGKRKKLFINPRPLPNLDDLRRQTTELSGP